VELIAPLVRNVFAGQPSKLNSEDDYAGSQQNSMEPEQLIIANPSEEDFVPALRSPSNGHLHADIDIIDRCNLRCPTCWRGVAAQKNTTTTMPLSRFREVVTKIRDEGYPNVALINWTEPFLCQTLHEYVPLVKEAGMDCWLSSNLSLRPNDYLPTILSTLSSGVDILFVSVSGFTQPIYEINHVGGRVDWIKTNLEAIAEQLRLRKLTTSVWIRFLEFPYNSHEKELWGEYARKLGIGFDPVPAHGDPNTPYSGSIFHQHVQNVMENYKNTHPAKIAKEISLEEPVLPETICSLIADRLALDAKGDMYLCCAYPNAPDLRIGSYVDIDEGELLLQRYEHAFCTACEMPRRATTENDRERFARALRQRAEKSSG
jgi:hypothetical protein